MFSRSSRGRPESTSQGHLLDVRLGCPLEAVSRSLQDIRSGRPQDVSLESPRDGQIESLWEVLGRWWGTSSGRPGDQYLLAGIGIFL